MGTEKMRASAFFGVGISQILSPALIILIAFASYFMMGWSIITSLMVGMITSITMGFCYVIRAFKIIHNLNQERKEC